MDKPNAHGRPPVAVGVSFRRGGKVYYFSPNNIRVKPGDHVLAKTERGVDLGEVIFLKDELRGDDNSKPMKPLLRRATRDDRLREEILRQREREAQVACSQKIAEHNLPMKLVDADYTFDGQRLVFFFSAEGRVDFRALVRDLAEHFGCRIELRQIGVRDEAKMLGGLGPCGRPLCCAQWLRNFDPVGIRVAKDQGMSLNPAKISGICDRLMCCLLYEHEVYKDLAERMPKVGDEVRGQGKTGRVKSVTALRERVTIDFSHDGTRESIEVPAADLRRSKDYWRLISAGEVTPFQPPPEPEAQPSVVMREPKRAKPERGAKAEEESTETATRQTGAVQPKAEDATEGAPPRKSRRRRPRRKPDRRGGKQPKQPQAETAQPGQEASERAAGAEPRQGDEKKAQSPGTQSRQKSQKPATGSEGARQSAGASGQSGKRRRRRRRRPKKSADAGRGNSDSSGGDTSGSGK